MKAVAEGPCEGPWFVMPKGSLSFLASPGGLPVPVGCPVLSVWPRRAFLSCLVLFCVSSPGGLLIPPNFPREIFWGVEGFRLEWPGRGTRPRPWMTTCHGLLSSQHRHGLQSSQHRHGLQSSQHRHGLQSSQLRHGLQSSQLRCLFRSGGPRPVFLSVFVLRGLQSARPPPLPGGTVTAWDTPSRRGSYVRVLLCVSCVPASCVHIWFVSCPCFMSLWVKYVPAVFVSLCVNYPVYLVPVFWVWFHLVYSLLPGVSCLFVLPWCH